MNPVESRKAARRALIQRWQQTHPGSLPNREEADLTTLWIVNAYLALKGSTHDQ